MDLQRFDLNLLVALDALLTGKNVTRAGVRRRAVAGPDDDCEQAIVRDRVRAMIDSGATLDQVKSARVTADYDPRYGAASGRWTTNMFVEAVYRDLSKRT